MENTPTTTIVEDPYDFTERVNNAFILLKPYGGVAGPPPLEVFISSVNEGYRLWSINSNWVGYFGISSAVLNEFTPADLQLLRNWKYLLHGVVFCFLDVLMYFFPQINYSTSITKPWLK